MAETLLLGLALPQLEFLAIPVAGLVSAGLLFVIGRMLFGRRRRQSAHLPEQESAIEDDDPFEQGSPTERRSSARRGGKLVEIVFSDAEGKTAPTSGWIVDRSV